MRETIVFYKVNKQILTNQIFKQYVSIRRKNRIFLKF